MEKQQINETLAYDLREIHDGKFIPWARNYATLRRIIRNDMWGNDILKTVRTGKGTQTRYVIVGRDIINYVKKYGPGAMLMARRSKNDKRSKK